MNGPDHYKEAERLLEGRDLYFNGGQTVSHQLPNTSELAAAQVHATLAQTAATIDTHKAYDEQFPADYPRQAEWNEVVQ